MDEPSTWNTVSPRLGFNWKVNDDGKTVLKAHAGRYYRGIVTGEFDNTSPSITPRYFFSGTYDAQGNPEDLELVSDNTNLRVDSGFRAAYTDQFTVGIERELAKNLGLSVNYVYKRGERYGGNQDIGGEYVPDVYVDSEGVDATGATIPLQRYVGGDRVFELTNSDRMFSRFNGVTVQLVKRMADNWQMMSSFVWGRSTGRVGSSRPNTDGRLIADRPITFKTQLVYQLPAGCPWPASTSPTRTAVRSDG